MKRYVLMSVLAATVMVGGDEEKARSSEAAPRIVYRDPQTGQVGAPPAGVTPALPRAAARLAAPPSVQRLPNGALARRTPIAEMEFTVVKRNPDGSLSRSCVQGDPAARVGKTGAEQ